MDPSSLCNHQEAVVKHYHWVIDVDFPSNTLHCAATLRLLQLKNTSSSLILDIRDLEVKSVQNEATGVSLQFEVLSPPEAFGSILKIILPDDVTTKIGEEFKVTISYQTKPSCSAIQWLEPVQTAGKKHPYLYTQCQPIHARSMIPCMDTPSVKATYTAEVTTPTALTALMSAERLGSKPHPTLPGKTVTGFEQKVPIPSYLMALVVGALESRKVGPRSRVWSEKEKIEQAEWDFSETDAILRTAEDLAGPYLWGVYDILVLPPSFPYGGMENPCLTFVSPTVLSATIQGGDKSAASRIVAHEVSHSWTGNLVTNITWEHFWLNEGWTTYLERKILARLYGEKERHLRYISGWKSLGNAITYFEGLDQLSLTSLVPKLQGVHPDDAFSAIPYEKGSLLLYYLETLLGGVGSLDSFIKDYLATYKFSTLNSEEWRRYFLEYFQEKAKEGVFDEVEWEKWFYEPGMPPYTPQYDTTLTDASSALADRWVSIKETSESALANFSSKDLEISLGAVEDFLNKLLLKAPLPVPALEAMDKIYSLSEKQNSEIKFRWLMLCLKSSHIKVFPLVTDFITNQGRMKYIRPLYRTLFECGVEGKELAVNTFKSHRCLYHSVAASQLEKDLLLRTPK